MAEIAELTGLRKSSLFHHFETKDALYAAAVGSVARDLGHMVLRAAASGGLDTLDRLDRLGDAISSYLGSRPSAARLLLRELVDSEGPGRELVMGVMSGAAALIGQAIDRHGSNPDLDANHAAMSILGLHLTWYAADAISGHLTGETVDDPGSVARRTRQIQLQVRGLCGLPSGSEARTPGR